jgi:voltage-gated potassium channel
VLVIGGGKVGRNAARTLKRRGLRVNMLEKQESLRSTLESIADSVIIGDAADFDMIRAAGIEEVPSVILTTNDDTVNIFIAIYCHKLNPEATIVSRVRHRHNVEAIHRAGADFVLSDPALGVQSVLRRLEGRELVLVGEGLDVFSVPVPSSLIGVALRDTGIRDRFGLSVIAIDMDGRVDGAPSPDTLLRAHAKLLFIGTAEQAAELNRQLG